MRLREEAKVDPIKDTISVSSTETLTSDSLDNRIPSWIFKVSITITEQSSPKEKYVMDTPSHLHRTLRIGEGRKK